MSTIFVFIIVFGGGAVAVIAFFVLKNLITPKKLITIERMLETGNIRGALRQAKNLLARNERNPNAHWYLGECYRLQNRYDLAVAEYKYITNTGKFTSIATEKKVRERLAEAYLKLGQLEESQKEYILLSKIDPQNWEYFFQIARLFEERNYTDSALNNYKKVIGLNPQHAQAYMRMGIIYFKKQLLTEAKKAFMASLKYDPQNYAAHYYLGKIAKASGDAAAAKTHFEKAQKDPDFKQKALLETAAIHMMKGDYHHAIADLERAIKLGENNTSVVLPIRYLLAQCYEINKDLIKAIEQWEKIYKINPKYRDVAEKLAMYSNIRADDALKDFMTASQSRFQDMCVKICEKLGLEVQDVFIKNQDVAEVYVLETQSKWRNTKKSPSIVRFYRTADPIGYDEIRTLYDQMRKINAMRSICVTASKFTKSAIEFAQIRPIDLIDKEELIKLLHSISQQS